MAGLAERVDELRRLVKTDADPRVRGRAQAVLMLAQGAPVVGGLYHVFRRAAGCGWTSRALQVVESARPSVE
jgi:hypothetical protein